MSQDKQEIEYQTNTLYRDHYRAALGGVIVMVLISVLLSAVLILQTMNEKQPKYYATTTTGSVSPLFSLSEPVVTDSYLLQWASLATRAAYNIDFNNYASQIGSSKPYFTASGFSHFKESLDKGGLLNAIKDKKLIMSAIVSKPPIITSQYVLDGVHNWVVQLPILVTFTSPNEVKHLHSLVTMRIQRVSTLTAEKGIQISNFMVQ